MKKVIGVLSVLLLSVCISAQSQFVSNEMNELAAASRNPLLNSHAEVILVGDIPWERLYGEREFVITPAMKDLTEYNNGLKKMSSEMGGENLMRFGFYNIELNEEAKSSLFQLGIRVPSYYELPIIKVMLPKCHALTLSQLGFKVQEDLDYGQEEFVSSEETSLAEVTFYSQGFEQSNYPLTVSNTGSANCGWGRENCGYFTGNWSIWCSNTGGGCESCVDGDYVNDVTSIIQSNTWIDVSNYTNRAMSYAIWSDLNDADLVDYVALVYALNNATDWTVLSTLVYYSNSVIDEIGWSEMELQFSTPNINTYTYGFFFYSDWSFRSYGVYLDDIKIRGTLLADVENKTYLSGSIFPNPANDIIQVSSHWTPSNIDIYDINGRQVMNVQNSKVLNVSFLNPGVYVVKMKVGDDVVTDRFIKD